MTRNESTKDFKAKIAALMRGRDPGRNGDYTAPHVDAATIMEDLRTGTVRAPDHRNGGATRVPRGGAALQIHQRKMWGDR